MAKFLLKVFSIFDQVIAKILEQISQRPTQIKNDRSISSLTWYNKKLKNLKRVVEPKYFLKAQSQLRTKIFLGKLYHFGYIPKLKDTLPFYDIFPLCIPLKWTSDGFIGLNLHYLSFDERITFLSALKDFERIDSKQELYLNLTYNLLKASNKYKLFRRCIKRYILKRIFTKFIYIDSSEWNITVFLPSEAFVKAKKEDVWKS